MPKKILLADDSITIQKVIELTFSDEDFEVVTVGNGRLALEKLEEVRPDIVLCDIMMPEKDGYEVCEHIKNSQAFSHVPVLLLTGAFEPFDQEKAAKVGSDGFLAKPFEPETLIAKVKDLMGRASAGQVDAGAASTAADSGATEVPPAPAAAEQPAPPASPADVPAATAPQPAVSPSPPAVPGLIPEEPFATLEQSPADAPSETADEALAPVSAEESASLAGEPPAGDPKGPDAASTVMFAAGDLPWTGQPAPPAPEAPPAEPPAAQPASGPPASAAPAPDLAEAASAAFEEVLEEDLEFGGSGPSGPAPETTPARQEADVFTPGEPLTEDAADPEPPPTFEVATPTAPEPPPAAPMETVPPLEPEPPVAEPSPEPLRTLEPETPPAASPPAPEPAPVFDSEIPASPRPDTLPPVARERQPEPQPPAPGDSNLGPLAGPDTPSAPEPAAPAAEREPAPADAGSFADVAPVDATEAPASEAASVRVPVDMVEKISQRVVAQVSEKVVREIAWEVIPDLAEALIKQEIERLKAELQNL